MGPGQGWPIGARGQAHCRVFEDGGSGAPSTTDDYCDSLCKIPACETVKVFERRYWYNSANQPIE
jgi:hypothetical protein